jgi:hypothetical protein
MKLSTKIVLIAFVSLLFLGFWLSRQPEDHIIGRFYVKLNASPLEHHQILRNANELSAALKKSLGQERTPQEFAAIDFDRDYVILTSDKQVVRVWTDLSTKIVSLKSNETNGIGLAIVRGKKDAYFKFTDEKRRN